MDATGAILDLDGLYGTGERSHQQPSSAHCLAFYRFPQTLVANADTVKRMYLTLGGVEYEVPYSPEHWVLCADFGCWHYQVLQHDDSAPSEALLLVLNGSPSDSATRETFLITSVGFYNPPPTEGVSCM